MSSTIYLLLVIQALLTIFLSGGVAFSEKNLKSITLGVFMLLFGIEILYFVFGTTIIQELFPQLTLRYYFSVGLLYGPILFIHFQSYLFEKKKLNLIDVLHLLPLLVVNIIAFKVLMLPTEERVLFASSEYNFNHKIMPFNYLRAIHQLIYAFILILLSIKWRKMITKRVFNYTLGIGSIFLISIVVITYFTIFASGWKDFKWYYFFNNLILIFIMYVLYKNPELLQNLRKKYMASGLKDTDMIQISERLNKLFTEEKIYLRHDLSKSDLAELIEVKPHHISQTFSNHFKINMNDYVNKFRIDYAKTLLLNPQHDQYTIEAIALDCGFNNKVTFYKAFSKFENETPSQFKKRNSKN